MITIEFLMSLFMFRYLVDDLINYDHHHNMNFLLFLSLSFLHFPSPCPLLNLFPNITSIGEISDGGS